MVPITLGLMTPPMPITSISSPFSVFPLCIELNIGVDGVSAS